MSEYDTFLSPFLTIGRIKINIFENITNSTSSTLEERYGNPLLGQIIPKMFVPVLSSTSTNKFTSKDLFSFAKTISSMKAQSMDGQF